MKPWFERHPDLLQREEQEVSSAFPNLYFVIEGETVRIRGGVPTVVGTVTIDQFQIEMTLAPDHPNGLPRVRELGGRVPQLAEYHSYADGYLCVFLPEESPVFWPPDSTITSFLRGPLNSYFVSFLHYCQVGSWPFGERAHGIDGVLDFYKEKAGLDDPLALVSFLDRLRLRTLRGHLPCVCRSGVILRRCHPAALALAATMSPSIATASLGRLLLAAEDATDRSRLHPLRMALTKARA